MGGAAVPTEDSMGGGKGDSRPPNQAAMNAIAGAISGCAARFVVGPLDVLKIRFQVQIEPVSRRAARLAAQQGSIAVLPKYTGMAQALITIAKEEGILAKALARRSGILDTPYAPAVSFISGATAGVAATMASYPFDLLRTTLAAQGEPKVYNNMFAAARDIVQNRGFQGLYSGLKPTLVEIIPYAALQFGLYDAFNSGMSEMRFRAVNNLPYKAKVTRDQLKPSAAQQFVCGLFAGIFAKLGTHPLDVVKKRFQVAGLARSSVYGSRIDASVTGSLWRCLRTIYEKEGIAGLYKGSAPSILKSAPQAAVTFAVYEFVMRQLNERWTSDQ